MAAGGLSPQRLYPLPELSSPGPLERLVDGVAGRLRAGWPRRRGKRRLAEAAAVATRAGALADRPTAERLALLRELRGRLRRTPDDPATLREALALAAATFWLVEGVTPGGRPLAAALALLRGEAAVLGEAADAPADEADTACALAALAAAPAGCGVHVIARTAERLEPLLARLQACCAPLGLTVSRLEPTMERSARRKAWRADISCTMVPELVTDALRDLQQLPDRPGDLRLRLERLHGAAPRSRELLQRGLQRAVLLEGEGLLLDDALRSVVLSSESGAGQDLRALALAWDVAGMLDAGVDFAPDGRPRLTARGLARLGDMLAQLGGPWSSPQWRAQRIELALLARHGLAPGKDYEPGEEGIVSMDGRLEAATADPYARRLLLDLLAIRHDRKLPLSGAPVATMSCMECFMRYPRLGALLGSADGLALRELRELYGLAAARLEPPGAVAAPRPGGRALARARAEHRQVAGRLQKLLAFSGRA